MPKEKKKVPVEPKKEEEVKEEETVESTEKDEAIEAPSNADIRALAEESLIEGNIGTEEEEESAETEPEEESSTTEESEEEKSDTTEEGDLLEETSEQESDDLEELAGEKKSGEQKRIDKLTASVYELKDELSKIKDQNASLKANKVEPTEEITAEYDGKEYTLPQLERALAKAIDDSDSELQAKVQSLMQDVKIKKNNVVTERKQELAKEQEARTNQEAQLILKAYSVWHGPNATEIYPGSKEELDVTNKESLIYRLAGYMYQNDSKYHVLGGKIEVFSDAFKKILDKKRAGSKTVKTKKEKALETKVTKLKKRTSSVPGTKTVKKDKVKTDTKPKSDYDKVKEETLERSANKF